MALKRLALPADVVKQLENAGYSSIRDVILAPPLDIQKSTGLTIQKIRDLYKKAHVHCAPHPVSVSKLLSSERPEERISFGVPELDHILNGGLSPGTILELSGTPGSGKTQLCNHIVLHTAVSCHRGIAYIDTEGSFSAERILEMGLLHYPGTISTEENVKLLLNHIKVFRPKTLTEMASMMESLDLFLLKHRCLLLVVDSIASICRRQYDQTLTMERASLLCGIASRLKMVAHDLKMAVVVTNHVMGTPTMSTQPAQPLLSALGPSWAHWVNTKIFLSEQNTSKQMEIVKSPESPNLFLRYEITDTGVIIT